MEGISGKIDTLYRIEKNCHETIKRVPVPGSLHEHLIFQVPVITIENELLYWNGYYENDGSGMRKHGFTLMLNRKYCVRSWDMAKKHYSKKEGRVVKGVGRHKHYHLDAETPRDAYAIPEGEISISDMNQAVKDFAIECNINLVRGYQPHIL